MTCEEHWTIRDGQGGWREDNLYYEQSVSI